MNTILAHPEDIAVCTGCAACSAVCPSDSITMQADAEGFLYPRINADTCTDCRLCRQTCPADPEATMNLKRADVGSEFPKVFAAWNLDGDIRRQSSSGGVFTALAEDILSRGGVVVGAAFDDDLVVKHVCVEKGGELHRLRGSKYVQSEVAPTIHRRIRALLEQGRRVLFSGTPCQVAGLRAFLKQSFENLFCCDLICHGVPSPKLFARYVGHSTENRDRVVRVDFRDKTNGWKSFGVRQQRENGESLFSTMHADPYIQAFLRNYALRPACYACAFATTSRFGDLTLGDFWEVAKKYPEYDRDDKGTSLLLVNNVKGESWLDACRPKLFLGLADLATAIAGNPMLVHSSRRPPHRDVFYRDLEVMEISPFIKKYRLEGQLYRSRILSNIARRVKAIADTLSGRHRMED